MRLRTLRRLEEMEIRKEHKKLSAEQKALQALLKDEGKRWDSNRRRRSPRCARNSAPARWARAARRSAPPPRCWRSPPRPWSSASRSPSSCPKKAGSARRKAIWPDDAELKFKEGDKLAFLLRCETTDRACAARHQRPRLHAESRRPAARPRRRPGDPPADRPRQRGRRAATVHPRHAAANTSSPPARAAASSFPAPNSPRSAAPANKS